MTLFFQRSSAYTERRVWPSSFLLVSSKPCCDFPVTLIITNLLKASRYKTVLQTQNRKIIAALKHILVSCGSTSVYRIPEEVIALIDWKALWCPDHIFHSFALELRRCLPRAPIHEYTITYGNRQMLCIKVRAAFSPLQNTAPLNTMLYILGGATWWIRPIITECQTAKKGQQGERPPCWRTWFPFVFAKGANLIDGKTIKGIRHCIIFYWVS